MKKRRQCGKKEKRRRKKEQSETGWGLKKNDRKPTDPNAVSAELSEIMPHSREPTVTPCLFCVWSSVKVTTL